MTAVLGHRIAFLALTALVANWYATHQAQILVSGGKGWDGVQYSQMYSDFAAGTRTNVLHPYTKRVGLPFLASRLPLPEAQAFRVLNLASGLVAIAAVFWMISSTLPAWVAWASAAPMWFHIFGPIRFPNFYPFIVDPPSTASLAIGALCAVKRRYALGGLAVASGILFREANLYFLVALLAWPIARAIAERRKLQAATYAAVLLAGVMVGAFAQSIYGAHGSQLSAMTYWTRVKTSDPLELLKFLAAVSLTLGPFLYAAFRIRHTRVERASDAVVISACGLAVALASAFAGGYDSTRIFSLAYPAYAYLVAAALDRIGKAEVLCLTACSFVANRAATAIPEPLAPAPNNALSGYFVYELPYASPAVGVGVLAFWALSYGLAATCGSPVVRARAAEAAAAVAGALRLTRRPTTAARRRRGT